MSSITWMRAPRRTHKPKVLRRFSAKGLDLFIGLSIAVGIPYSLGPLLGFAYVLLGDGLHFGPFFGQSIGKKFFGLQTFRIQTHELAGFRDSTLRNIPIGVVAFFGMIPVWGWIMLGLIGIPLLAVEAYLVLTTESQYRIGDAIAETEVSVIVANSIHSKAA